MSFALCYPTLCISVSLCVKVTVLLWKCQREHCPLSQDITAVKSLSTQTNLHRVSYILSPHTHKHSCSPGNKLQQKTRYLKHIFYYDFIFNTVFAVRLVILAATIAAISTQNTSMWWLRGQKGRLFSGEYSMQTKKGNYSLSWKIHKNLYLCESAMRHWRCKNEFDRSYRFLACLSKRGCVQWAVPSSSANYIFPTWLKMCWNVHYHVCLHENMTSARSEHSKHEGMSLCLLVGLSRTVPSCVCIKQRHSSPCCVIPD